MSTQSTDSILRQKAGTTEKEVVDRILAAFDKATPAILEEGSAWYPKACIFAQEKAIQHNLDIELVATVIAHLSPRVHWKINKRNAESVLSGEPVKGIMGMSLAGCIRAFRSDDPYTTLNGPKVKAFAANILAYTDSQYGSEDACTIDTWAAKVALGSDADCVRILGRKGVYEALSACYRQAAKERNVSTSTVQATTWVVVRNGRHE